MDKSYHEWALWIYEKIESKPYISRLLTEIDLDESSVPSDAIHIAKVHEYLVQEIENTRRVYGWSMGHEFIILTETGYPFSLQRIVEGKTMSKQQENNCHEYYHIVEDALVETMKDLRIYIPNKREDLDGTLEELYKDTAKAALAKQVLLECVTARKRVEALLTLSTSKFRELLPNFEEMLRKRMTLQLKKPNSERIS